jgi:hypothetical protein
MLFGKKLNHPFAFVVKAKLFKVGFCPKFLIYCWYCSHLRIVVNGKNILL